jgi:DNA-binding transcriptional regulator GbsR (MarR family)
MNAKAKEESYTTNAYFFTHKSTNAKAKKRESYTTNAYFFTHKSTNAKAKKKRVIHNKCIILHSYEQECQGKQESHTTNS